jgi:hypothetical protein
MLDSVSHYHKQNKRFLTFGTQKKSLKMQTKEFYFYCRIGDQVLYLKYIPKAATMVFPNKSGDVPFKHLRYNDVLGMLDPFKSVGDARIKVFDHDLKM